MSLEYFTDKEFKGLKQEESPLVLGEYEVCTFRNCDLSDSDLSAMKFIDTGFINCNLSNARIGDAFFQDITFKDCKMLGLHFNECSDFRFACRFDGCQLESSSFYQKDLKHSGFVGCELAGVDFGEADLEGIDMLNCNLADAMFERTNLMKVDFTGSTGFAFDPEENRIKGARFSLSTVHGLLQKYGIIIEQDI